MQKIVFKVNSAKRKKNAATKNTKVPDKCRSIDIEGDDMDIDIDKDIDINQILKKAAKHDLNLNISLLFSHKYLISLHGIRGLRLADLDLHY